jgi:hypothetical protein
MRIALLANLFSTTTEIYQIVVSRGGKYSWARVTGALLLGNVLKEPQ